jgi:LytS/YehU family sensor histidine kinase
VRSGSLQWLGLQEKLHEPAPSQLSLLLDLVHEIHLTIIVDSADYQCSLSKSSVDPLQSNGITEGSMRIASENHGLSQSERTSLHGARFHQFCQCKRQG